MYKKSKNVKFNNIQYQICKMMGYIAIRCYFRYSQSKNNGPTDLQNSQRPHSQANLSQKGNENNDIIVFP